MIPTLAENLLFKGDSVYVTLYFISKFLTVSYDEVCGTTETEKNNLKFSKVLISNLE